MAVHLCAVSGMEVLAIERMANLEHYPDLETLILSSIDSRTDTLTIEISTASEYWSNGDT